MALRTWKCVSMEKWTKHSNTEIKDDNEKRTQGSHSTWKTLKNDNSFSSHGKVMEFYNFIKNHGKMGMNLEK